MNHYIRSSFSTRFTGGTATKLFFIAFPDGPTYLLLNRGHCSQPQLIASSSTFLTTKCQDPQEVGVCATYVFFCGMQQLFKRGNMWKRL